MEDDGLVGRWVPEAELGGRSGHAENARLRGRAALVPQQIAGRGIEARLDLNDARRARIGDGSNALAAGSMSVALDAHIVRRKLHKHFGIGVRTDLAQGGWLTQMGLTGTSRALIRAHLHSAPT